jgi:hypothetical protein
VSQFIQPFISGLGSFIGANQEQNWLQWLQNSLIQQYNNSQNAIGQGWDQFLNTANPLRQDLQNNQQQMNQWLFGNAGSPGAMTSLGDEMSAFNQGMTPDFFRQSGLTGGMQGNIDALSGLAGGLQGTGDTAQQLFAGGGWTPQGQGLFDRGFDMLNSQDSSLAGLQNLGGTLAGQQGQTGMTQNLGGQAMNVANIGGMTNPLLQASNVSNALINQGGRTPGMDALSGAGQGALSGMFGVGGLTPTGAVGEGAALDELINQGETGTTNFFQNRGAQLAGQDALMSPELAVSFARDQARRGVAGAAESARRQALARGGGPGAVVASGIQNEGMADFADQAMQAEAQAVQNALQKQQELQLQQQAQGAQMGLQGGQLAAQRFGSSGNMLGDLEGVASQRFGQGGSMMGQGESLANQRLFEALGLLPQVQQQATNLLGTTGQLGIGAGNLENARMGTGVSALGQDLQSRLGALGGLGNILGNQQQFALGGGNLANNVAGQQGNLMNLGLQGQLAGGQLGLNQSNAFSNNMLGGFGARNNLVGTGAGLMQGGWNPQAQLAGQGLNWGLGGMGLQHGVFNPLVDRNNPMASWIGNTASNFRFPTDQDKP